jgi:RND family efflux transporter MFP subunit
MRSRKAVVIASVAAVLLVLVLAAGIGLWVHRTRKAMPAAEQPRGPMPLPVVSCEIRDLTDFYEFTGTTEAVDSVEIRARVEGYLRGIHFTDGQIVEEGQLLFTIEPEAYAARRQEASARLKAAQAELERARVDLERIEKAVETNAVSRQDLSTRRAAYESAQAAVEAAQAALADAELNLSYTQIQSPFRGRIGRHLADVGELVGPQSKPVLASLVRTEPIYVFFYMSESMLDADLLRRIRQPEGNDFVPFFVGLGDQTDYPFEGRLCFVDNSVDPRTGTVYVRGQLPNDGEPLLPGMFVRVRVPVRERPKAVLIPEKTIQTDLGGKYVLVVGANQMLERRDIVLGATEGTQRVVLSGLDGSETILSGGFYMARPGMPIQPIPEGQMPAGAGGPAGAAGGPGAPGKP